MPAYARSPLAQPDIIVTDHRQLLSRTFDIAHMPLRAPSRTCSMITYTLTEKLRSRPSRGIPRARLGLLTHVSAPCTTMYIERPCPRDELSMPDRGLAVPTMRRQPWSCSRRQIHPKHEHPTSYCRARLEIGSPLTFKKKCRHTPPHPFSCIDFSHGL